MKNIQTKKIQFEDDPYIIARDLGELKSEIRTFRIDLKSDMIIFNDEMKCSLKEQKSELQRMMGIGFILLGLFIKFGGS